MRPQTAEQLIDALDQDRIWRVREIAALKGIATSRQRTLAERLAVSRAGVALSYAHWEGFVKRSAERYLHHVSLQRVGLSDLSPNFKALYWRKLINKSTEGSQLKREQSALLLFERKNTVAPRLPYKDVCSTLGNLGSTNLLAILEALGLDQAAYIAEFPYLDKQIVQRRHVIAHGSGAVDSSLASVDPETFTEVGDRALNLLTLFATQIQNAAVEKRYRSDLAAEN